MKSKYNFFKSLEQTFLFSVFVFNDFKVPNTLRLLQRFLQFIDNVHGQNNIFTSCFSGK